ncbi:DEAD box helicase [Ectocarpus siliculosus]|uniref:DEAD box helicase n=1 Tax=Ectocarpus siliculosus TaxID=2880 RepID=D8LSP0_ECTSI|nr:DEAD box helicase [Ectocarpus siliculosus]|eukprot:CBN75240.1 DEAD box helicase [Ectocarpus siliculosus]
MMARTFRELFRGRLPDWLLNRLEQLGFATPTLVQRQALEVILGEEKHDAVLHAQTGSGKTLAFLLPLLGRVDPSRAAVQGLVVVPTRELGLQVAGVAKRLAAGTSSGRDSKIQVMSVLEGSSNKRQRAWAWADPPHIVIGNPESLTRLVTTGAVRVNAVSYVVVDEVDACLLSEGTRASLHELLARSLSPTHADEDEGEDEEGAARLAEVGAGRVTGAAAPVNRKLRDRQTVFASATVPQHNHFIRQCVQKQWTLTEPVHVQVHAKEAMPPCLSHYYVVCPPEKKLAVLRTDTRGLVFALATKPLEGIAASLDKALGGRGSGGGGGGERGGREQQQQQQQQAKGWDEQPPQPPLAEFLRQELGLNARADAMSLFREGKTRLLVSTDMAARGLDVPEITHVFNLDLPLDGEGYVHRGGRAGRLGRPGKVISLVTPQQEFVIRRLGNGIGVDIKKINLGSSRRRPKR